MRAPARRKNETLLIACVIDSRMAAIILMLLKVRIEMDEQFEWIIEEKQ